MNLHMTETAVDNSDCEYLPLRKTYSIVI